MARTFQDARILTLDVGGTKFTVGGFEDDRLLLRETQKTDRQGGPAALCLRVEEIVRRWKQRDGFVPDACGIGFGGPVDFTQQIVTQSTHVAGWSCYPLAAQFADLTQAPVLMDNDANVGALGEAGWGAGRGCVTMLYLTLSTGIGGGILSHGRVLRGADSYAGEIGHINIVPDGPVCLCGSQGCLERLCCGLWLERDYGRPASELLQDPGFVDAYVVYLARGLKAALMILNPNRIVIGGGISKLGDRLFLPLRKELDRQMPAWSKARRDVVPAALADDSVLFGALALGREALIGNSVAQT